MTSRKRNQLIAWGLCLFAVVGMTAVVLTTLIENPRQEVFDEARVIEIVSQWMVLNTFAILGALIISRQPNNRIGWLLMLPALARVIPFETLVASPPETITIGWWLLLWFDGWAWMPLIFPILLLPLHFPTGRPPSPRWNWVNWLALSMWALLAFVSAFVRNFADHDMIANPIGFLPPDLPERIWSSALWGVCLFLIATGSVLSLFVRYRRAQTAERQQIKWLVYAGIFFAAVYGLTVSAGFSSQSSGNEVLVNILFSLSVLGFAVAIGIAILRYRLYDIDVIIRKTLVYAVLTGLLAIFYFGSVVLLQALFEAISGQRSAVAIVISTLFIAALFAPLRRRVQTGIDRRFFRQKYDAQRVLAQFAQTSRDEVSLEVLTGELTRVVQETMQPKQISVWMKPTRGDQRP